MSHADTLRQAAKLMRERAGKASRPGPWLESMDPANGDNPVVYVPHRHIPGAATVLFQADWGTSDDAVHIAGMHPGVALAVAGWLEHEAFMAEQHGNSPDGSTFHAVKVARAYLGEGGA